MTKIHDGKVAAYTHVTAGYNPVSIINASKHESSRGEAENSIIRKVIVKRILKILSLFILL